MGALLARESSENTRSALDNIPVELQLACLARVPYKDLREGVTCTCKSWRSLVASDAFRKMRAACGFSEWAVFASDMNETANCYLITASGAYLTAPRPPVSTWHAERLTGASGDVVAVLQPNGPPPSEGGTMRAHVYDPRRNRWSPIAPIDREFDGATSRASPSTWEQGASAVNSCPRRRPGQFRCCLRRLRCNYRRVVCTT